MSFGSSLRFIKIKVVIIISDKNILSLAAAFIMLLIVVAVICYAYERNILPL